MNPEEPTKGEKMDAKKKEAAGLDFWGRWAYEKGFITKKQLDDFIEENNTKEERMDEMGLPQLEHYGVFSSMDDIEDLTKKKKESARYIIRCENKESGEIKRLIDGSADEIIEFVRDLSEDFDSWRVEVKEFAETVAAGTIVVYKSGETVIESWEGPHYKNVTNVAKYWARYNPNPDNFDPKRVGFDRGFSWGTTGDEETLKKMQTYALRALRYIFPHLKPKENEPIYLEYGVKKSGGIYFLDMSTSEIMTDEDIYTKLKKAPIYDDRWVA